eukprot:3240885-Amphidinium_carterae.2
MLAGECEVLPRVDFLQCSRAPVAETKKTSTGSYCKQARGVEMFQVYACGAQEITANTWFMGWVNADLTLLSYRRKFDGLAVHSHEARRYY